jgi:hypothetical protein
MARLAEEKRQQQGATCGEERNAQRDDEQVGSERGHGGRRGMARYGWWARGQVGDVRGRQSERGGAAGVGRGAPVEWLC